MSGRSPRSPAAVTRWAVEVGKETHRLLDFVIQEPEVVNQSVSLVLVYVMSEVPCAMGISYSVSQLESRVADIHEAHIMESILKPLVMELHFKKKLIATAYVARDDKPDVGLCQAAIRVGASRLVVNARHSFLRPNHSFAHGCARHLASHRCSVLAVAAGKKRSTSAAFVLPSGATIPAVQATPRRLSTSSSSSSSSSASSSAPSSLVGSPLHPPALTRESDSAIAQASSPPLDPRPRTPPAALQSQSRHRSVAQGQGTSPSRDDTETARLTPPHSSACSVPSIPVTPDRRPQQSPQQQSPEQQQWGAPCSWEGWGADGGPGGGRAGNGTVEAAGDMRASARGCGDGRGDAPVSSWAERQRGAAVDGGSARREEGERKEGAEKSERSGVDEAEEGWTGSSKEARRGRGARRESETDVAQARQELHEARCMVQQLHAELDLARAAAAQAVALAAAAQGERELVQHEFREYSEGDLLSATDGFSDHRVIGHGSNGRVYRGDLNHTPVAIRRLDETQDSALQEFDKEVRLGSRLRHPNIVLLLGCCRSPPCLVYELMPTGSLYHRLLCVNNSPPLLWHQRFDIAANIAAALAHLHCREHPIVHFDLKPTNVLLDRQLQAKITGVGVARVMRRTVGDDSMSGPMDALGFGYACPELLRSSAFCSRTDVYALGMLLYDLLGATSSEGRVKGLIAQVDEAVADNDLNLLQRLTHPAARWPPQVAMEVARLARQCTAVKRRDRPDVAGGVLPVLQQLRPAVESFRAAEEAEAATLALQQQMLLQRRQAQQQGMEGCGAAEEVAWEVAPNAFRCPITLEVMQWPVMAADGHTYEESAAREWLAVSSLSPKTLMPLPHLQLTPNHALRSLILEWMEHKKMKGMPHGTFSSTGNEAAPVTGG